MCVHDLVNITSIFHTYILILNHSLFMLYVKYTNKINILIIVLSHFIVCLEHVEWTKLVWINKFECML
jgi:hypothetical protein